MTDRFDVGPLLGGMFTRLRRRSQTGEEATDWIAVGALILLPLAIVIALAWSQFVARRPDQLIAAFALLAGSLVAAFSLLATWRSQIPGDSDGSMNVARRRVDEAAAHSLTAAFGCMVGAAVMVILTNLPTCPSAILHWLRVSLSSLGVGVGVFVSLSFLISVNLIWDAYCESNGIKPPPKVSRRKI